MASIRLPSASFLDAFLPVVRARLLPQEDATQRLPLVQQIQQLRLKASLIPAALAPIPTILGELWDGILKAVPKKKTSHMKKRHRQMAGKALKDVTALNKCSACGRLKRAHILCPYCVQSIRQWFGNGFKSKKVVEMEKEEQFAKWNEELRSTGKRELRWEDLYDEKDTKKDEAKA
ncbi:putative 54S ribosomal protein L32, mitochondrial [Fulvia fulva]|uniref:Large ribosomal subunit protein bL32m n=1 Tax=Passalora fulva TaxID=5499 RepID=A0A9Q8PKQ1_PASFU|nr:putative 54S ribosomal protein L32, mitochondrial [Fulvia fulva]KAK4610158.1 putative 54S ribosomal protein L32, mitochondrial [Fulvia fulva]KAK4611328.1 putative 54S ribosomal protein L32, mitochondrial [Fulvia fulva]UJO24306.1 putative 54S ribosomal protein L32, mitochondrial [Fulvia fulva]WPV21722.1 putative 54S ribosomal protein L32, mitochondrial [Fulvia fulva]WPV37278.1 putative 54S ribosomal protein L32, mitochondrial [Fulvia fulva]